MVSRTLSARNPETYQSLDEPGKCPAVSEVSAPSGSRKIMKAYRIGVNQMVMQRLPTLPAKNVNASFCGDSVSQTRGGLQV